MSDRNLPESDRGLQQLLARQDQRIRDLQRTVSKSSTTRVGECNRTFFDGGSFGDGGFWTPHLMVELDVDPGRWLVEGLLQFELLYTGLTTQLGYQWAHAFILYRPIGSPAADATVNLELVSFDETPLAAPIDMGSALPDLYYRTTIPLAKTVTSETGLTLALYGEFLVEGGTSGTDAGSDLWIGPGVLIASPL